MTSNVRKLMARLNPPIKNIPIGEDRKRFSGSSGSMRKALEDAGKYRPGERGRPSELALGFPSPTRIDRSTQTRGGFDADAMTPQDIAAALGLVGDPLAREIFAHLWWPDGAMRTRADLDILIDRAMLGEYEARERERIAASLELHMISKHSKRTAQDWRLQLQRSQARSDSARQRRFPMKLGEYEVVRNAVLNELSEGNLCWKCGGRGEAVIRVEQQRTPAGAPRPIRRTLKGREDPIKIAAPPRPDPSPAPAARAIEAGELLRECDACDGTGIIPVSARDRAEAIAKSWTAFRSNNWIGLYHWTFCHCRAAEARAANRMKAALELGA